MESTGIQLDEPRYHFDGEATRPGVKPWSHGTLAPLWMRLAAPTGIVLGTVLVLVPVLLAGFVFWDDYALVMAETRYRSLAGGGLAWMLSTSLAGHWQPLTWLSYWLDYQIAGPSVFLFHLTNLLLHAANALLFYFISLRFLRPPGSSVGPGLTRLDVLAAGAAALFFAIHPLRVESVAWIAERRDVLSGVFFLLALLAWLRYVDTRVAPGAEAPAVDCPESTGARLERGPWGGTTCPWWYLGALLSFALSLSAKSSGAMLPLVLLLLDFWPLKRWSPTNMSAWRCSVLLLVEKTPFLALSAAAGLRAIVAQDQGGALYDFSRHGWVDRAAQALHGLAFYPLKTILPTGLGPLYEIPADDILYGPRLYQSAALLASGIMAAIFLFRRSPALAVALAAYAILLSPVLGFTQSGPQFVADRYSYLPSLPLILVAAGGLRSLARRRLWQTSSTIRAATGLAVVTTLTILGHLTMNQTTHWQDGLSLWSRGVAVSPNSAVAHTNLADAYARLGPDGFRLAVRHYQLALQRNPRSAVALDHWGRVMERIGRSEEAGRLYARALAIDPRRREAALSLGRLLAEQGQGHSAVAVWKEGLSHHPMDLGFLDALADILSTYPETDVRNGTDAVAYAEAASAAREHQDPHALVRLATAQGEAGRFEDALRTAALAGERRPADDPAFAEELAHRTALLKDRRKYIALPQSASGAGTPPPRRTPLTRPGRGLP